MAVENDHFSQPKRVSSLGYLGEILKLNLMSGMAYRVSFLSQILFMILNNAIFMVFWWVFFQRFQQVQGWRMQDVYLLFSVSAMGFGLSVALCGNALRLSQIIQEGQIDYYLVLPPKPLLHILVTRMNFSGFGDFLFGILLYLLFLPFAWKTFLLFLFFAMTAAVVFTSFWVLAHSLTFFIGSAEGISQFVSEALLTFSLYPETLFTGSVRILLFTLLPAGFVSFIPIRLMRDFSWPLFSYLLLFAGGLALLARMVFYHGLRRYESGNLISPRS
jgi:ABC-2 type transport system permease protein